MRAIISAAAFALLMVATSAAGLGLPYDDRGSGDACSENNDPDAGGQTFTCFEVGNDATPMKYYIDTGRADGWPGIWEEDNLHEGLQKVKFQYSGEWELPDTSILS